MRDLFKNPGMVEPTQISPPGGATDACSEPSSQGWGAQTLVKQARLGGR